jgi:hypothetical protein
MVGWTTALFVSSLRVFILLGLVGSAYLGHYIFQLEGDIFKAIVVVIAGWAATVFVFGVLGLLVEMTNRLNDMVNLINNQPTEPSPATPAQEA